MVVKAADTTGTTNDPKLVVEHSVTGAGNPTLQDMSYQYDANGNITQLYDASRTEARKTLLFTYDDINRLTIASTDRRILYTVRANIHL